MVLLLPRRARGAAPPPSGGVVFSDDFNRANGAIGSNWTNDTDASWQITSNQAGNTGGTPGINGTYNRTYCRCNTSMGSTSHYAQIVTPATNTNVFSAAAVGMNDPATELWVNFEGYYGFANAAGFNLYKSVGGTETVLATLAASQPTRPYTIKLVKTGADLELFSDGVSKITHTDGSPLTGTYAGMVSNRGGGIPVYFDDFEAGV